MGEEEDDPLKKEENAHEEITSRDQAIYQLQCMTSNFLFECNLTKVDFSFQGLEKLPIDIFELHHLTFLNLNYNQVTSLPEQISNLKRLEKFHVNNNQLESLPIEIGDLSSLKELELYNNHIETLPLSMKNLTSLQEFILNQNKIQTFPKECCLPRLRGLDLDHNCLESLPKEIGKMSSLQWLFLDDNHISELPEQIGNLTSLERLFLSDNNISSLPLQIKKLTSLHRLFVEGNPVTSFTAMEFGEFGFHITLVHVPSLKSICGKFLLDFKLYTSNLPNELKEYLDNASECLICGKNYFEPVVEGCGLSEFEWYTLPFAYNLCSSKCAATLVQSKIAEWKSRHLAHARACSA